MTDALPSLDVEVMVSTPEMPETAFSMGSVTSSSTFSAEALGSETDDRDDADADRRQAVDLEVGVGDAAHQHQGEDAHQDRQRPVDRESSQSHDPSGSASTPGVSSLRIKRVLSGDKTAPLLRIPERC